MAIYRLSAQVISRGDGRQATAAAAYRSGSRLRDERTGLLFDYRRRGGVVHTAILAPESAPDWMKDRTQLWNAVETVERRKDAQLSREIQLALPHELSHEQRVELVEGFVREAFVERGMVADIAIHGPHREGDERNHHAHVMLTMRELLGDGFGKKVRDWNDKEQLGEWREQWAAHVNRTLERSGHKDRVDHRSYEDRGIDREPEPKQGPVATQMEREGQESHAGRDRREVKERNAERDKLEQEIAELRAEVKQLQAEPERSPEPQREEPKPEKQDRPKRPREQVIELGRERARKAALDAWRAEPNAVGFSLRVQEAGFQIAQGRRDRFVLVDGEGKVHPLGKLADVPVREIQRTLKAETELRWNSIDQARDLQAKAKNPFHEKHQDERRELIESQKRRVEHELEEQRKKREAEKKLLEEKEREDRERLADQKEKNKGFLGRLAYLRDDLTSFAFWKDADIGLIKAAAEKERQEARQLEQRWKHRNERFEQRWERQEQESEEKRHKRDYAERMALERRQRLELGQERAKQREDEQHQRDQERMKDSLDRYLGRDKDPSGQDRDDPDERKRKDKGRGDEWER